MEVSWNDSVDVGCLGYMREYDVDDFVCGSFLIWSSMRLRSYIQGNGGERGYTRRCGYVYLEEARVKLSTKHRSNCAAKVLSQ